LKATREGPSALMYHISMQKVLHGITRLTEYDIYLFKEGRHRRLYEKLGAHLMEVDGLQGTYFAVWAPNAQEVSVIGDFNGWSPGAHPLAVRWDGSGIWEGFIPGLQKGTLYKYHILSRHGGYRADKGDPLAFYWQRPPETASIVWDLQYQWHDQEWMAQRARRNSLRAPMSIYEVHLGSWRRGPGGRWLGYRELAPLLAQYVKEMGFTHVQFLPVMEHPFYGSWGYQCTGYFAPSSRYGTPQDFMFLVEHLHQQDIGVILDWVPSHFPDDAHGLCFFDGTYLYEHQDPRKGYHPEWHSYIFNHGRNEVRSFLISSALYWLKLYHADGLRVDAVASMLYLDYARGPGEWVPNVFGGRENLEAIEFLRLLNEAIYAECPDVQSIAEESTAWPMVSRPTYVGGLGFGLKWNMGWMHDTLQYFSKDPVHRKYHHNQLTFSIWYAFSENFVLPLSHDEVVYGKGSLLQKMPGDEWQKFANLRLLLGYMFTHPGKKLLFMGGEFGQPQEWYHEEALNWDCLKQPLHQGLSLWVKDLHRLLRAEPALYELDTSHEGFQWVDASNWLESILCYLRLAQSPLESLLVVLNFTPVVRNNYLVGVPQGGFWKELLNSDATCYGGSGVGNLGGVEAQPVPHHGRPFSLRLSLPPLGMLVLKRTTEEG